MKNLLLTLGTWLLGSVALVAGPVTLTWSAQEAGSALCLADGTPLASGQKVRLGYFDVSPEEVRGHFMEVAYLQAHFTELAATTTGQFEGQTFVGAPELSTAGVGLPEAGACFAGSVTFTPVVNLASVDGRRCYMWAMNGPNLEQATQYGIFSSRNWVLHASGFGATQWDLSQVSATDPADVLLGRRGPQTSLLVGGPVLRLANVSQMLSDVSDEDHDGANGLLEVAFAMDPTHADSSKLPQLVLRNGHPCLEFQRKISGVAMADGSYLAGGFRYVVEVSENLQDWQPCNANDPAALAILPGASATTELASLQLNPSALPVGCQFARVRVERVE